MNPEKPRSSAEIEKDRAAHEKVTAEEKKYSNPGTSPFRWIDKLRKRKTTLTPGEIMEGDARRINELKDKEKVGSLTEEERHELEQRESSELFIDVFEQRHVQPRHIERTGIFDMPEGRIYKEAFYPVYQIKGVVDGKEVVLEKYVYPADTPEFKKKLSEQHPFYMRDWKGSTISFYEGKVDGQKISDEEAKKLFGQYQGVAQRRSGELRDMKGEKETKKYGHHIEGDYEYRVTEGPDDFSNLNSDSSEETKET